MALSGWDYSFIGMEQPQGVSLHNLTKQKRKHQMKFQTEHRKLGAKQREYFA